jgi:hypothetical protein
MLTPLPPIPYEYAIWKQARVHIDSHVEVERHYYSVPHALVGERVEVRITATTIEICHRNLRVASHIRSPRRGARTTVPEHLPKAHRKHLEEPEAAARLGRLHRPARLPSAAPETPSDATTESPAHENVRGPDYYR